MSITSRCGLVLALVVVLAAQIPMQSCEAGAYDQLRRIAGPGGNIPDVPDPVCGYCNRPLNDHAPNCPYYNNGGTSYSSSSSSGENTQSADITEAPIITAPVGAACGVIGGAGWYFNAVCGKYKKKGALKSYHDFLSIDSNDPGFDKPVSFGMHLGGLPWLALYAPTWAIKEGVVGLGKAMTPAPKPPDPRIRTYEAIADSYAQLGKGAQMELDKRKDDAEAAEWRRTKYLDDFIADRAELRALKESDGVEAARAEAQKRLDAWSKSLAEKEKLYASISADLREKDAFCREAIKKASVTGFLTDLSLSLKEKALNAQLADVSLSAGAMNSLKRQLASVKILDKGKTALGMGIHLKDIWDSYEKAQAEGEDFGHWWDKRETTVSMLQVDLKLLPMLSKTPTTALSVGATETFLDGAYALTASVAYHDQMELERETLQKLRTASVFEDAMAIEWDRVNIALDAARERENAAQCRVDQYGNLEREYDSYANQVRRGDR